MTLISKNVMATLLIITILISVVGTWAAISSLMAYREVPVAEGTPEASGKVSVYVLPPPAEATGKVTVTVLPSKEGG